MTTPQPPAAPEPVNPAPVPAPAGAAQDGQNAMLVHLGGILFNFIPGLVVWLSVRGRRTLLEDQALEALNFQLTLFGLYIVTAILALFGLPLGFLVWIAGTVFAIIAGLAAKEGRAYRYPATLRLVK
ncbi:DUF4870 domain-containing protein [Cellulomonas oligotrophica]|uniref:Membrane protein n=1 Tax=Cellulomonas oligotrophica TaxID=931536 RepID=A0A7Y9JXH9_9CELL|nr:DUF4870 domain-containing protein [Cellulomonas oligotrophica]NYD86748.1 hypothetical protein [Cellulomonas oligotrophica]GIG32466.1 membrane protein [Cellulomonas oligotrophica]